MDKENENWNELKPGEVIKLAEGEHLTGKFVSIEESTMYKESYAVTLDTEKGQEVTFVSAIVKDMLNKNSVNVGDNIRILYKGMKKTKDGSREYKDYSVFVQE